MIAHSPVVYPETKGVPLEEMDEVFGEGNVNLKFICCNPRVHIDSMVQLRKKMTATTNRRQLRLSRAPVRLNTHQYKLLIREVISPGSAG